MQRLQAIQDDLNFDLSRQFVGNKNAVYKKLKEMTNIPNHVDMEQELESKFGRNYPGGPMT